jgi:DNA-binding response OmpR family regulator
MNSERPPELPKGIKFPHNPIIFPHAATIATPPVAARNQVMSGERILIAEDDPVSCEILVTRLQKWGYETVITRDGHEAMTVMRAQNAPALAVLDWMMPGMDGIEVCRRLREISKAVYIIFLTSLGTKDNILEALEAGADDYLVKPFDAFQLQTRVRVGLRIIGLQTALADRVKELETAGAELQNMRGRLQMLI